MLDFRPHSNFFVYVVFLSRSGKSFSDSNDMRGTPIFPGNRGYHDDHYPKRAVDSVGSYLLKRNFQGHDFQGRPKSLREVCEVMFGEERNPSEETESKHLSNQQHKKSFDPVGSFLIRKKDFDSVGSFLLKRK